MYVRLSPLVLVLLWLWTAKIIQGSPQLLALLGEHGAATEDLPAVRSELDAYGWISLHTSESQHPKHAHLDSRLSAIYYVNIPDCAPHAITFYDPRGISPHQNIRFSDDLSAPPFSEHYTHKPHPGELLIFPSWLVHSVEPIRSSLRQTEVRNRGATGDDAIHILMDPLSARVSVSFNIGSGWEGTAPVWL